MIDLRSASILDFVPESIADDPEVIAISLALDPELQDVAAHLIDIIIMPRIDQQPVEVLDAIGWSMRLTELAIWDTATVDAKRALLKNIFAVRKKSGTPWSLRRAFDIVQVTATIIEWWQEGAQPNTYRIEIDGSGGVTREQLVDLMELVRRFARTSQKLAQTAIEANSTGQVFPYPALTSGHFVTIPFGGP